MLRFRVARKLVALLFCLWEAVDGGGGGGGGGVEDKTLFSSLTV